MQLNGSIFGATRADYNLFPLECVNTNDYYDYLSPL